MKRRCWAIALWMLAGLSIAAGQTTSALIVFDSTSRDLGRIAQGDIAKQVFAFRNEGTDTLEIRTVETS